MLITIRVHYGKKSEQTWLTYEERLKRIQMIKSNGKIMRQLIMILMNEKWDNYLKQLMLADKVKYFSLKHA